jgi:nucleotide-binding universal stress UspA family protein
MFGKILVAVDEPSQRDVALDLVRQVATEALSEVRVLHLRERELNGHAFYSRETKDEASFVAESAVFDLRMEGFAAGGGIRHAVVDRIAEAILDEARAFDADLIVLGKPRRGEFKTRLLGSVSMRVIRRSNCPVIVAARRAKDRQQAITSSPAPERS